MKWSFIAVKIARAMEQAVCYSFQSKYQVHFEWLREYDSVFIEVKGNFYFGRPMIWSEIETRMFSVKELRIITLFHNGVVVLAIFYICPVGMFIWLFVYYLKDTYPQNATYLHTCHTISTFQTRAIWPEEIFSSRTEHCLLGCVSYCISKGYGI